MLDGARQQALLDWAADEAWLLSRIEVNIRDLTPVNPHRSFCYTTRPEVHAFSELLLDPIWCWRGKQILTTGIDGSRVNPLDKQKLFAPQRSANTRPFTRAPTRPLARSPTRTTSGDVQLQSPTCETQNAATSFVTIP